MSRLGTVQYMRSYPVDELAGLQQQVQGVFVDIPSLVAMAVLAQELRRRLDSSAADDVRRVERPPDVIQAAIDALNELAPELIRISVKGLSAEEPIS